jgi:tRNA U55 pseudouridine synthase TruB
LYRLKEKSDKDKVKCEEEKEMQIRNIRYKIPQYNGCLKMIEGLRRFESSEVAKKRLEIMEVYEKYGEEGIWSRQESNKQMEKEI